MFEILVGNDACDKIERVDDMFKVRKIDPMTLKTKKGKVIIKSVSSSEYEKGYVEVNLLVKSLKSFFKSKEH